MRTLQHSHFGGIDGRDRIPRLTDSAFVAQMKLLTLPTFNVYLPVGALFDAVILKPDEISGIASGRVIAVLSLIIDHTRTMGTASEHRMRPLLQTELLNCLVLDEEELVGSGNNSNVDLGYVVEASHGLFLGQAAKEGAGTKAQESARPLTFKHFPVDRWCGVEQRFWIHIEEAAALYGIDAKTLGGVMRLPPFFPQEARPRLAECQETKAHEGQ